MPWRPVLVFLGISVGATSAASVLSASVGWDVHSPAWGLLAPIVMWAPALGALVARRTVDRGFTSTLSLTRWGATGWQVIFWPIVVPIAVYGAAYAIASSLGLAHWSPGGGKWKTGAQVAANVVINLAILGVWGTFTALGEEIGWRGYLQPRLDAAGVRASVVVVWLSQLVYHAPVIAGAGYVHAGGVFVSIVLFFIADLPTTFLWARESYRARSLWPAVFFHSFHNTVSQWVFPKFFAGGDNELWLGETGILPVVCYVALVAARSLWVRRRGPSWQELAQTADSEGRVSSK